MTAPVTVPRRPLLVVEYLGGGGTFESLYADHMVKAKPYRGKVSFCYDKIGASDSDPVAQQCRGLVLREGSLEVVAYPFDRFFNLGQGAAATIHWPTARFEEKLDGTLLIVYWDDDGKTWRCATRQMCEAHGDINGVGTFAYLADKAAGRHSASFHGATLDEMMEGSGCDRGVTYMFELTSPYNRVVCEYNELGLTLLGARRLSDFAELDPHETANALGFKAPRTWGFASIEDLIAVMRDWSPLEYEGVIVRDHAFNRVKVKSPQYLAAHHATDSLGSSWRNVCEAVQTGHADDIMAAVPQFVRDRIESLRAPIGRLIARVESDFEELRSIDDMKTYAFAANARLFPGALFALKRGKTDSAQAFVRGAQADTVLELCRKLGWDESQAAGPAFTDGDP